MEKENKIKFIHDLEALLRQTRAFENLVVEPGYREFYGTVDGADRFVPSKEKTEWLLLRWEDQDRRFGRFVPIDGDSNWGILIDTMKVLTKMA